MGKERMERCLVWSRKSAENWRLYIPLLCGWWSWPSISVMTRKTFLFSRVLKCFTHIHTDTLFVHHMCTAPMGTRRKHQILLELELQKTVVCVDARNGTGPLEEQQVLVAIELFLQPQCFAFVFSFADIARICCCSICFMKTNMVPGQSCYTSLWCAPYFYRWNNVK